MIQFLSLSWSNLSKDVESSLQLLDSAHFLKRGNDLMTFCMINAIPLTYDYKQKIRFHDSSIEHWKVLVF